MPTTPFLGIQQLTANQSQKEVTINDAILQLESASCGTLAVPYPTLTVTLSVTQFTHYFMFTAGTATADAVLQVPHAVNGNPSERLFGVRNTTGHGLTVRSDTGGGGVIVIPNGEARLLAIADNNVFIAAEAGTAVAFLGLTDVPHSYTGKGGQALVATIAEDGLEFIALVKNIDNLTDVDTTTVAPTNGQTLVWDSTTSKWKPGTISAGASTFLALTDTPANYTGAANQFLRVNGAGTAVEFIAILQVPTGGTSGDVLTKGSGSTYTWAAPSGGGGISDAPSDGTPYARQDAGWVSVTGGGGGGASSTSLVSLGRVVTSGSQTTVSFNSIPATYRDLYIRIVARSARAGQEFDEVRVRYNGDTGSNYDWTRDGSGTGAAFVSSANNETSAVIGYITGATSTANYPGVTDCRVLEYRGSLWNKAGLGQFIGESSTGQPYAGVVQHNWNNNNAITDIVVLLGSGSAFIDGSIVELVALDIQPAGSGSSADNNTRVVGSFAKWVAAKARGSGSPARVLFSGDSNVAGEGALGGTFPAGCFVKGFAHDFAVAMGWGIGSVFGNQNVGNTAALASYNPTLTFTGSWGVATGGADIIGGVFLTCVSGGSGHISWTPAQNFAVLTVTYPTNPGLNGATTVKIDGTLVGTLNENTTAGVHSASYTVTLGSHTVEIASSGSGDAYIHSMEINDGTANPVYCQGGWSGGKAADFAKTTNAWSALNQLDQQNFDYVLYYCTINDAAATTGGAAYYKAVEAFVATASATANGCLFVGFPLDNDNCVNDYYNTLATMLRNLAKDYGWSFYDLRQDLGYSFLKCNAAGYAFDANHPNATGHGVIETAIFNFLGPLL